MKVHSLNFSKILKKYLFSLIDEMGQNHALYTRNPMSKEKYEKKERLIEADSTMSTQQKLDAMDQNFKCRRQEQWQNILSLTIPIGLLLIYGSLKQSQTR